jgi:hypothetical protein
VTRFPRPRKAGARTGRLATVGRSRATAEAALPSVIGAAVPDIALASDTPRFKRATAALASAPEGAPALAQRHMSTTVKVSRCPAVAGLKARRRRQPVTRRAVVPTEPMEHPPPGAIGHRDGEVVTAAT